MINYTVKYGEQEHTWVEHNVDSLHKGKQLRLEYLLGQVDQTVQVTLVAKSMQEVAQRYDTYNNMLAESPKAGDGSAEATDSAFFVEKPVRHDLFEVQVEFDLHSVIAQTYNSMRPARPLKVLRKYK